MKEQGNINPLDNLLKKKFLATSLATTISFLIFLTAVPYIAWFIFIKTESFLQGRDLPDLVTFVGLILMLIMVGGLLWYVLYLKSTSKIDIKLTVAERIKELLFSIEKFQKLFENAPIPYLILDPQGNVKDINKAGLRFFHGTTEEIMATNLFSYIADDDGKNIDLAEYYQSRSSVDKKQVRITTRKGDVRWVELSFFEIREPNQDYSGFVSIFDITDAKNLEQTKTEFISLASHQMRTPLATTKWYAEMLLTPNLGELNEKQKEYIRTMKEVNSDMIDLVNTLLNISRMEIGKITAEIVPMNAAEMCDNILVELSSQIAKKNMNIIKQYDGLLANITSDPKLLRIIIHNLLTNAIKYTPDGGNITIIFKHGDGKNSITVSDTGCGIPAGQQNKIFTKLFRADNVKDKSSSQSTGLGLYLIKSLVEVIGGTIGFKSVENQGSSFTVVF